MSRTPVLTVLLTTWLATGIVAGFVRAIGVTTASLGGCWALRSARCSCRSPLERTSSMSADSDPFRQAIRQVGGPRA